MSAHNLTRRTSRATLLAVAAAALFVAPVASHAAVTALEGFNYPANGQSLAGLNGGTGFSAAWADATGNVDVATTNTSLAYPPGVPLTPTGSRVEVTATAATTAEALATRSLAAGAQMNLATNGLEFYSSALFRRSAATGEAAGVNFFNAGNTRWAYGIDAAGKFFVSVDPANAAQRATSAETANANETYLVVARIRTNTGNLGNDEVFLEIFGEGETVTAPVNDAAWDLTANGNSGVTLNGVRLEFTNAAGQTNQFDEFRLGTTFTDVTGVAVPEPAALGLVGVAAVLGLRRRRR